MKKELEHYYSSYFGPGDEDKWTYSPVTDMWYEDDKEIPPLPAESGKEPKSFSCDFKIACSLFCDEYGQTVENEQDNYKEDVAAFAKYLIGENDFFSTLSSVLVLKTTRKKWWFKVQEEYALGVDEYAMWSLEKFIEELKTQSYASAYLQEYWQNKLLAWTDNKNQTRFVIQTYNDELFNRCTMFDVKVDRDWLISTLSKPLEEWKKITYQTIKEQEKLLGKKVQNPPRNEAIAHFFPDLFPVSLPNIMKNKISERLQALEKQHHIKIFYAVESGSRAWGFGSQDSDYDVRFLYYHQPEWYFSVSKQTDNLVKMEGNNLLDFAGWELKKALNLLLKGNMSLYEWLHSPIVYKQEDIFAPFQALAKEFYNPKALMFSYVGLAENNYKAYADRKKPKLKKYLYILRTLAACRWIAERQTPPPIEMEELKEVFHHESLIRDFLDKIIENKKKGNEWDALAAPQAINRWIEKQIVYYKQQADSMPILQKNTQPLSDFFYQTVMGK